MSIMLQNYLLVILIEINAVVLNLLSIKFWRKAQKYEVTQQFSTMIIKIYFFGAANQHIRINDFSINDAENSLE